MNNTKKINDNGNTPSAITRTKEERERAELAAYLAAGLFRCRLTTLRCVFAFISDEMPQELTEREKEIQEVNSIIQTLTLDQIKRLHTAARHI